MNDTELLFNFMKARQLHCTKKLDIVSVIQLGGGRENYCLTNAENKANELGCAVISGWLSLPLKAVENNWQKQFTQHWWNYDRELKQHVDYSPAIEMGALYIVDTDIMEFTNSRGNDMSSHVASSIIYRNLDFYIVDYGENGYKIQPVNNLSNETIFSFQLGVNMAEMY
jgi:hypothetical protein